MARGVPVLLLRLSCLLHIPLVQSDDSCPAQGGCTQDPGSGGKAASGLDWLDLQELDSQHSNASLSMLINGQIRFGRVPLLLHYRREEHSLAKWYAAFLSVVKDGEHMQGVVEPHPPMMRNVERTIEAFDMDNTRTSDAFLCPTEWDLDEQKYYAFTPDILHLPGMSGMKFLLEYHGASRQDLLDKFERLNPTLWRKDTPEVWTSRVKQLRARCATPGQLLEELHANPEDVAAVVIDAAGAEVDIINEFLAMERFEPAIMVLPKSTWVSKTGLEDPTCHTWRDRVAVRGYSLYQQGPDVVAVFGPKRGGNVD